LPFFLKKFHGTQICTAYTIQEAHQEMR